MNLSKQALISTMTYQYDFVKLIRLFKITYQKLSFTDRALLYFTFIIIFFIGIFIPIRWSQGDLSLVSTNTATVIMAATVNLLLISGYKTTARRIFVGFMFSIVIIIIQQNGLSQINWVYPGSAMLFFSMPAKTALKVTSLLIAIIGVLLWNEATLSQWLQIILSLKCTILIVYTFCTKVNQHVSSLQSSVNKHKSRSMIDGLSGLENRRSFDQDINQLIHCDYNQHYLILLDVDHFKLINDQYGHDVGDSVIKQLSSELKSNLRDTEKVYRIGGEEFAVIITAGNDTQAMECAERLRLLSEASVFTTHNNQQIKYTISAGISPYYDDVLEWFRQADKALYEAKSAGRNNIQLTSS